MIRAAGPLPVLLIFVEPPGVGSDWDETGRVDGRMTSVEVPLDLVHVYEFAEVLLMVQMLDVSIEAVVGAQRLLVAFEVEEEYGVEAYQELE